MLKINHIRIEVNTDDGLFGASIPFLDGLNIIRGNNTSGKSTLMQCLFYGLGLEELIGGKGDKTMQSVLKDFVEEQQGSNSLVVSSCILLEFSNASETVTTRRFVKSEQRDNRLIEVMFGDFLSTGRYKNSKSMYLHDPNAAKDVEYGFHAFLEKFLAWDLPLVSSSNGNKIKLISTYSVS